MGRGCHGGANASAIHDGIQATPSSRDLVGDCGELTCIIDRPPHDQALVVTNSRFRGNVLEIPFSSGCDRHSRPRIEERGGDGLPQTPTRARHPHTTIRQVEGLRYRPCHVVPRFDERPILRPTGRYATEYCIFRPCGEACIRRYFS